MLLVPENLILMIEPVKIENILKKIKFHPEIVLIASSTGGPRALEAIIPKLKKNFPAPILIVQHITSYFIDSLAARLNRISQNNVKVAQNDESITAGTIYLAPGGFHMRLDVGNKIYLDDSPAVNGVRPAADVLFESVAQSFSGQNVLTVILSGMGSDGKNGLAELKNKKDCFCLVQSENTCIVYGMPGAAVENGYADMILDLNKISCEIESFNYTTTES